MAGIETRISNAFLLRPGSMRLLVYRIGRCDEYLAAAAWLRVTSFPPSGSSG